MLWQSIATDGHADAVMELHPSSKEEVWIDTGFHDEVRAIDLAARLRTVTWQRLGFVISVGVGWCKTYAKLASLAAKPPASGLHVATQVSPP